MVPLRVSEIFRIEQVWTYDRWEENPEFKPQYHQNKNMQNIKVTT
jgi:hypothetical protein